MDNKCIIEPFGIEVRDGQLHIDGYPTAKRVCKIATKKAKKLADLRLHEVDLTFCANTMQLMGVLGKPHKDEAIENLKQREAFLIAVLVRFCACFGKNIARSQLPINIFNNKPYAQEAFKYTRNLRNKHVVHDENNCRYSTTCAVLDEKNELIDVISIRSQFYMEWSFYENLFNLISDAQKYVASEIEKIRGEVLLEVNALGVGTRAGFPDVQHSFPNPSDVIKPRSY